MKRDTLTLVASPLILVMFTLALSVQSFADDKKEVAKDVKFACSRHGPGHMQLTLSLEKGDPQTIVITGQNMNGLQWLVTINGQPAKDGNGGKNKDTIKVHSGDTITWKIAAAECNQISHGVAFAEKDLAQAMLEFDTTVGKPLEDLNDFLTTQPWKDFGTKRWGTKPIEAGQDAIVMVSCKVKG